MGVDFVCGDICVSFNYSYWYKVRLAIFDAFIKYANLLCTSVDNDPITSEFKYNIELAQILTRICEAKQNLIDDTDNSFIVILENIDDINTLIHFNLGGIYTLLYKSDCEGYYSIGNSYDIYNMLQLIKQFISNEIMECIPELEDLFKASFENKQNVLIC